MGIAGLCSDRPSHAVKCDFGRLGRRIAVANNMGDGVIVLVEIDIDVEFGFPVYDVTASNPVVEVHAISFGAGHGIPTDPELAAKVVAIAQQKMATYPEWVALFEAIPNEPVSPAA